MEKAKILQQTLELRINAADQKFDYLFIYFLNGENKKRAASVSPSRIK
jgi:hypothetical protein